MRRRDGPCTWRSARGDWQVQARLAVEPHFAVWIGECTKDLDRHVTSKLRVAGAVDLAHPANAQQGKDFKRTET